MHSARCHRSPSCPWRRSRSSLPSSYSVCWCRRCVGGHSVWDVTRIIAGEARGRRLQVPIGDVTRPTSDRAREGLFSSLQSLGDVTGARVLDLYAGSGAVGLEALSRGALSATFVEDDPSALNAIRDNIANTKLAGANVVPMKVEHFLAADPEPRYDVAFLDPPYDVGVTEVL